MTTVSIRLPEATKSKLDKATKLSRRSRSFLVLEALNRHLDDVLNEQSHEPKKKNLSLLLSLAKAGASKSNPRTAEEVDTDIRWLRSDE